MKRSIIGMWIFAAIAIWGSSWWLESLIEVPEEHCEAVMASTVVTQELLYSANASEPTPTEVIAVVTPELIPMTAEELDIFHLFCGYYALLNEHDERDLEFCVQNYKNFPWHQHTYEIETLCVGMIEELEDYEEAIVRDFIYEWYCQDDISELRQVTLCIDYEEGTDMPSVIIGKIDGKWMILEYFSNEIDPNVADEIRKMRYK